MDTTSLSLRTILPIELQAARLLCLVRRVTVVKLHRRQRWILLIEGRGFRRTLGTEVPPIDGLHRNALANDQMRQEFFSKAHATSFAESIRLQVDMAEH